MTEEARTKFELMWKEDEPITQATKATLQIDAELGRAIDLAVHRLEEAMLRIGRKYKRRVRRTDARLWHVRTRASRIS